MDASALICQFTNVVCVAMTAPMDRERGADKLQSRSEIQQQLQLHSQLIITREK